MMRIEAAGEEKLRRLRNLVTGHVERFGRRDGSQVDWQRAERGNSAHTKNDGCDRSVIACPRLLVPAAGAVQRPVR
ncbi:DUF2218 domain-containing protein [Streptomyces sp. SID9913]|uniref:DUF2218 domain-containing protein n=2 Tax=unclassified Streptomyces TaxID=2593676 RepID=A0A6G3QUG7_9ACTN|nr:MULTISPECIES: DUF2218 domain-containing protein [unclassified Streptomyces]NEA87116.1 DUF2218 domain-containing protein [Streptomyces sp. SID14436]NEC80144.1 DUF2218 domain-containing protein [Streptomyces sp. SID7958]NED20828.1 DUF2218 domain-containing protein [Streptomyces sp. SID9913]